MSIIDSEGKIFGKINVFDFSIAVIVVFFVVAGLYFQNVPEEQTWKQVDITIENSPEYMISNVEVGDKEYRSGNIVAEIKEIKVEKQKLVTFERGEALVVDNPLAQDLILTINILTSNNKFKGTQIKYGNNIHVSLERIDLKGTITKISNEN